MPTSSREDFVNGLLGVGMLDAEWQTERFLAEERRWLCQVNRIHSEIPVNCRWLLYAISMA